MKTLPALVTAAAILGIAAVLPLPLAAETNIAAQAPAGRGGWLLPPGFLSTRGSQIVDSFGNPVRLACIGWNGTGGPRGNSLHGLWSVSYRTIVDAAKGAGFNCMRIPFSDLDIDAAPANTVELGTIDFSNNSDLRGLTTLEIFQKIVAYAGQIGMKIILDHHSNGSGGQQANGLWFDLGPGSDGTDGAGRRGSVTAERFLKTWVHVAKAFAGNPTVIGFDLKNEPHTEGRPGLPPINWGGGGPTDIHAMYETVGNAIQAVNPDVLIICAGFLDYHRGAPEGDLRYVPSRPVKLRQPNKVVYSVHIYPSEIGGYGVDSGPEAVRRMNTAWGFLVRDNIAPVWIGEMGSSMKNSTSRAWAMTLLDYMNGKYSEQGGPRFVGNQQPIGGSWWLIGSEHDEPNGLQVAWGPAGYRPEQLAVTDQMLFRPRSGKP
ncbi:Glycoside hydrolase family 5 protein [Rhodovastum atsumiense]|uniref:cellulase n=1 Tax=Rhodovastum atsumiense TaxID=504468 RepID=A0A5M6J2B1_9PROT|nr:glycoside hydrolase family 5 protein [Rhodovastum atsumiense]KAA5614634.1 glycoside hydrolase family 5 protein [Rhodovastum atsumiense]CAH2599851.1 Glycoside hydrolase family 5 protein [Rhodovastum atsumiense]